MLTFYCTFIVVGATRVISVLICCVS